MHSLRRIGTWLYDQPYLLLTLTALFWGGNVVLGRSVAGHVPPIGLAFVRWSGAFAILVGFAWPQIRRDWPMARRHLAMMGVLSLTGVTLYNTLAYYGLQYTQAINGLLLQSSSPVLIAICTFLLYGERLNVKQALGVLLSMLGVVLIVTGGDLMRLTELRLNAGDLWILLALAIYALYSALLRRRPPMHGLSFLALTFGFGALLLAPAFLWEVSTGFRLKPDLTTTLACLYVAIFPSILAYFCFNRGVELVGANRAGPFFHLIPLFGAALAFVLLGEAPHPYHALAFALIISGVVVATRR